MPCCHLLWYPIATVCFSSAPPPHPDSLLPPAPLMPPPLHPLRGGGTSEEEEEVGDKPRRWSTVPTLESGSAAPSSCPPEVTASPASLASLPWLLLSEDLPGRLLTVPSCYPPMNIAFLKLCLNVAPATPPPPPVQWKNKWALDSVLKSNLKNTNIKLLCCIIFEQR